MKLNIGNKILMLLHWLCSLLICMAFALCLIVPDLQNNLVSQAENRLGNLGAKIAGAVLLALYLALSVTTLLVLLRRKKHAEKGFITVGSDDKGKVRIAVSAVEQMVRQSVRTIDGITDMKVDIEGLDDAIAIAITASIASGAHVPTITANMQRAITQFVEVSCGVSVQSVAVTINAVSGKGETSRHRLMGRNKPQVDVPEPAFAAETRANGSFATEPTTVDDAPVAEAAGDTRESAPERVEDSRDPKAAAFDLDKPYESEFAKDYAAMKAREAAGGSDAPASVPEEE